MPKWDLTLADGQNVSWEISGYKKNRHNVILTFGVHFRTGFEVYTLTPTHRHKSEVTELVVYGLDEVVGLAAGYELASAFGVLAGLTGGAVGLLLGYVATKVAKEWFEDESIDSGDYHDSKGNLVIRGLLTLKG